MRFLVLFFFSYVFTFAQTNAFKTVHTSNNFDDLDYKSAYYKSSSNIQYHASAFQLNQNQVKLSGINLTFKTLDLHQVDSFFIQVYTESNGMPNQVIYSEDIHRNNYFCNQSAEGALGQNIDFFFRNPIYLDAGNYWIAFYASLTTNATEEPKLLHCSSASSYVYNGNSWTEVNSTIKYSLYGVSQFIEPLSTESYHNSFGPEELDGWVFSDLFPEGILEFNVTDEVYAETDDNTFSIKMSSYYGVPFESQMFYNLTSPKFKFLANHTYAISTSLHPSVYPSGRHFPVFSLVFVPDPPELGFLEPLPGNMVGTLPAVSTMDSLIHNDNFYRMTHYYTPTEDIETRIAIHTELGSIPQGESADYWLDHFSIVDTTSNLGVDDLDLSSIQFIPNPTKNTVQVQTNKTIKHISVLNTMGQVLLENQYSHTIDLGSLPAGVYWVKVKSLNDEWIEKVIKQ